VKSLRKDGNTGDSHFVELATAQLFGPERWWSNPDQDEVRGNSDGSL